MSVCASKGVVSEAMYRYQSASRASRFVAECGLEGGEDAVASRGGTGLRGPQEIEEGQELLRVHLSQVIDQGPGGRIRVATVALAEAEVADEGGESGGRLEGSPVGEAEVVDSADARPSAASEDFELGGEPLVQPDREIVVARRQAATRHELMHHLVGRRAEIEGATLQVQEQLLAVAHRACDDRAVAAPRSDRDLDERPRPIGGATGRIRPLRRDNSRRRAATASRAVLCRSELRAS